MRRGLVIATCSAAVASLAVGGAAPSATADPAPPSTIRGEAVTSSAGFLGCVRHTTPSFSWPGCIVAYRLPDGQVAVRVIAPGEDIPGTQLNGLYAEEAVLPAASLKAGGDLGYPVVWVSVPEGALPRTGAIHLRATAGWGPSASGDSMACIGPPPGTLKYAFTSDSATRSIADADVTGTWNGAPVMIDADDPCGGIYGALFTEPVTGAWSWAEPHDDSLW